MTILLPVITIPLVFLCRNNYTYAAAAYVCHLSIKSINPIDISWTEYIFFYALFVYYRLSKFRWVCIPFNMHALFVDCILECACHSAFFLWIYFSMVFLLLCVLFQNFMLILFLFLINSIEYIYTFVLMQNDNLIEIDN